MQKRIERIGVKTVLHLGDGDWLGAWREVDVKKSGEESSISNKVSASSLHSSKR